MSLTTLVTKSSPHSLQLSFDNHKLLPRLFGEQDKNLKRIEEKLNVVAASRGNIISLSGKEENTLIAGKVLEKLYNDIEKGMDIGIAEVDAAIRMETDFDNSKNTKKNGHVNDTTIKTLKKQIIPFSPCQAEYIKALFSKELCFAIGPAGTGKTYLAVAVAVSMFLNNKVDRIILSRPAVEAGEKLGFLPGDMREKVDPYLRPLYDALHDMLPAERVMKSMQNGEIEIAPLAFMRGRTLQDAFVILDEAQNATPTQMKMFLTRLGRGSHMAVMGDLSQTDLPKGMKSGLRDAIDKLKAIPEIATIKFSDADIVRHELTIKIVQAYQAYDKKTNKNKEDEPHKS